MIEITTIFLPLIAALIAGLGNRRLGDRGAQFITCSAVGLSAVMSLWLLNDIGFQHHPRKIDLLTWIDIDQFQVKWALRLDTLSAVMISVVTIVSAMVHVYSVGYMAHDHSKPRFMSYLSFFTFMMLMLVTADNFIQMFFGWEGVGVASYLLIGFWYEKPSANNAAMKAFIVNRVGDFGFIMGISLVFIIFNSVSFDTIFENAPRLSHYEFNFIGGRVNGLTLSCIMLFIGAMGKSAQLGLHTWLPDAMEGPTPVSALIHAATMVTAGIFMLCRCSPLFEYAPEALKVVTVVGGLTAIFAATIGLTQFDIKRVIAYSTMSQLGYMFFAIGVSAYSAAMFHLVTHAFFKALLFLSAGSVIHGVGGEQDMRKMGGLRRYLPITHAMMLIGSLALAGIGIPEIFGFAGFYSKDSILESTYAAGTIHGRFAYWIGITAALFTAFYSWRLLFMTFSGKYRGIESHGHHGEHHAHDPHESPLIMTIPLMVLSMGAIFSGWGLYDIFVGEGRNSFWGQSLFVLPAKDSVAASHAVPLWVGILPLFVALAGIAIAWLAYKAKPGLPAMIISHMKSFYKLVFHKFYFDEIYDKIFVRPANRLAWLLWHEGDEIIIDGVGPNGLAILTRRLAGRVGDVQTGYVFHYAFVMLIGVVAFVSWYLYRSLR